LEKVIDGRNFPVHRWMLAARSKDFEAMFRDDRKSIGSIHRMDSSSDEVEQFIKFLCKAEFEEVPSSNRLVQLAVKYKVENQKQLLPAAHRINL